MAPCTLSGFRETDLSKEIVLLQPPASDLDQYLEHYISQKAVHPALGAMLIAPASYTHPLLAAFDAVETLRSVRKGRSTHFQDLIGRPVRGLPPMAVYIDRPGNVIRHQSRHSTGQ